MTYIGHVKGYQSAGVIKEKSRGGRGGMGY